MAIKEKIFDNGLVVKHRRSAIILENANGKDEKQSDFTYSFTKEGFKEFVDYITKIANEAWANIKPKEANSEGTDYWEYYDRKYDNNGYLYITETGIKVEAPNLSKDALYQFNKAKIQSFIYDLQEKVRKHDANYST